MRVKLIPLLRFGSQFHKALTSHTQNVFFSLGQNKCYKSKPKTRIPHKYMRRAME